MARKKTAEEKTLPMVVYGVDDEGVVRLVVNPAELWDYDDGTPVALYRREVVGKISMPTAPPVDFKLRP